MTRVSNDQALNISAIFEKAELSAIRDFWSKMANPEIDPNIYLSRFQQDNTINPAFLVAKRGGEIVTLLVGRIESKVLKFRIGYLPVYHVRAKVWAVSDRGIIGAMDPEIAMAMVQTIMNLLGKGVADFAHLACLDINSPIRRMALEMPAWSCRERACKIESRWFLKLPTTFENFLSTRSHKTRSNIRKNERALLKSHPDIKVQYFGLDKNVVGHALKDVMAVCRMTYQYKLGLSPLCSSHLEQDWELHGRLGRLALTLVYIQDKPVAFSYAHLYNDAAIFMTPGYDPAFSKLHVGQFASLKLIEQLIETGGFKCLDYGLGYAQYKESFGSEATQEGHVRIFAPTWKGIYLNLIRTCTTKISEMLTFAANRLGVKTFLKKLLRSHA